jgi:GMP reductase
MSKFVNQIKYLDFQDVLIEPISSKLNSRNDVDLTKRISFQNRDIVFNGIPIIAANMTTTGTFEVYKVLSNFKIMTAFHKFYTLEDYRKYIKDNTDDETVALDPDYFIVSCGISENDFTNLVKILDNINCHYILIDVANGYIENFKLFCKRVRAKYPYKVIIAGNVCTKDGVKDLIDIGIDIIKIGIGGGSACTTRIQTGIGMPQMSCILECVEFAKNYSKKSYILSDGGITCPGNLAKAFGAGADFVMSGSMFAGHNESGGELIEENNKKYKVFYGMSSTKAMEKYSGGVAKYRSSEGKAVKIAYRGPVEGTILDIQGGIRSCMTYLGAKKIKDIPKCATFVRVNRQLNQIYNGKEV